MIPTDTIDKLRSVWRSVTEVCHDLDDDQWSIMTECPGWTVKDNLSHLIGTERKLQGLAAAPGVDGDFPHVKNEIGRFNENEIEARRPLSGDSVLAEWTDLVELRLRTLLGADDAYFAQEMSTPTGPGTMADFLHIRVLDCYAHYLDIRRALGRERNLDSAAAAHTVDRLLRTVPIVVGKRAKAPEGSTVVLRVTGPIERTVPVTIVEGRAKVVDEVPAEVLSEVSMDAETFLVLALGRRTAEEMADGWSVTGDQDLGRAVVSQFSMMI